MFRACKTGEIDIDGARTSCDISSSGPPGAPLQLRGTARGRGSDHRGRRFVDQPGVEGRTSCRRRSTAACWPRVRRSSRPERSRIRSPEYKTNRPSGAPLPAGGARGRCDHAPYLRGRTESFNCFAIRALTTVLAGILIASPVAGLRPMRAFRFCTTSLTIPGSTNSPDRFSSFSASVVSSSKNSAPASASLRSDPRNARRVGLHSAASTIGCSIPVARAWILDLPRAPTAEAEFVCKAAVS